MRLLPLGLGLAGTAGVLANRFLSQVRVACACMRARVLGMRHTPTAHTPRMQTLGSVGDAATQSRADVLVTALAAVLLLTGLQWSSVKARDPPQVRVAGFA